ncbi:MAG: GNAT family N-acetyltransferase [Flavobacteriales bacterium]|nr:GNAT family N-acetyltransferase [Flavobacteriales bacterium]
MSAYDLRLLDLSPAGIAAITALLQRVFPEAQHFTEAVVRWEYVDNPDGPAVGFNAWMGDELAAHYVTIPLVARVNGMQEKGLLSLNTATAPEHQGKGLFTKLADSTYTYAAKHGYGFVVGVTNANSTHGFIRKLGFQLVSPLKAMAGVGPLAPRDPGAVQYERVWHRDALNWRLAHPLYRYSVKHDGRLDVLVSERSQFGARLLLGAMPPAQLQGVDLPEHRGALPFRIWVGLDKGLRWGGRPYLNIPMRLRPSPLNLIFKDLTGQGRTLDPAMVRFQALDFDTL